MAGRRLTLEELARRCNDPVICADCAYDKYCDQYKKWRDTVDPIAFISGIDAKTVSFTEKYFREEQ